MVRIEPDNPQSPRRPADLDELLQIAAPQIDALPFSIGRFQLDPPIDSSNIKPEHWIRIAKEIEDKYEDYQGFVVLHGTDTLAYTASALSFLLQNLAKPVILTGSQTPAGEPRNDAIENLITALMIASPQIAHIPPVPEVCVLFRNKLMRGNRVRPESPTEYIGFSSPNYMDLGTSGDTIRINNRATRNPSEQRFYADKSFDSNVMAIRIFPGIKPSVLRGFLETKDLRGVVLEAYGAGNVPASADFLRAIGDAVEREIVVVVVSQSPKGTVALGLFDVSDKLREHGAVSGLDMTPEAALTKLGWLLGQGLTFKQVRDNMQLNHSGEQSKSLFSIEYEHGKATPTYSGPPLLFPSGLVKGNIESAHIRLQRVRRSDDEDGPLRIRLFVNLQSADEETEPDPIHCIECPSYTCHENGITVIRPATEVAQTVIDEVRPTSLSIVSLDGAIEFERATLTLVCRS